MRSCDSPKIETVDVQSSTDPLNNNFCPLIHFVPGFHQKGNAVSSNANDSYPTDTSSIAITTYNILRKTRNKSQRSTVESIVPGFHKKGNDVSQLPSTTPISSLQRSSVETVSYFGYYSQPTACIANRFGECGLFTTALDKLWYVYS